MVERHLRVCRGVVAGVALALGAGARGEIVYTEAVGGDLSNNPLAPTPVALPVGVGSVIGTVWTDNDQQDWFCVTVPAGGVLTGLVLGDYDSTDGVAFIGFRAGNEFRGDYQNPGAYTGYSHMGVDTRFTDLLPLMADQVTNPGSIGFTVPLPEGAYTFIVQQTGAETLYRLDFEVSAVPGPAGVAAVGVGALALAARRRRLNI